MKSEDNEIRTCRICGSEVCCDPAHAATGRLAEVEGVSSLEKTFPDRTLDCLGDFCPTPVLRTRQAMDEMAVGQVLELWVNDPAAEEDIQSWAKRTEHQILDMAWWEGRLVFHIRKTH